MAAKPPLRGDPLHQAIQERLKEYILEHHLQPGDPLPTEQYLARELGIGRNSLREAIKALQAFGLIEVRHGFGSSVGRLSLTPLVDGLAFRIRVGVGSDLRAVHDLLDVRQVLEMGLIGRVAGTYTRAQMAELQAIVAAMELKGAREENFADEDHAFHIALYRPVGNELLDQLLDVFWRVFQIVRPELPGQPPQYADIALMHRAILTALESADSEASVAAMSEHFSAIQSWIGKPAAESIAAGAA